MSPTNLFYEPVEFTDFSLLQVIFSQFVDFPMTTKKGIQIPEQFGFLQLECTHVTM